MQHFVFVYLVLIAVCGWAGLRLKATRPALATVFFTLAAALGVLLIAGLFGLVGGPQSGSN